MCIVLSLREVYQCVSFCHSGRCINVYRSVTQGGVSMCIFLSLREVYQCVSFCHSGRCINVYRSVTQGGVSQYMCERYGFAKDCKVIAFTGDNPGMSLYIKYLHIHNESVFASF